MNERLIYCIKGYLRYLLILYDLFLEVQLHLNYQNLCLIVYMKLKYRFKIIMKEKVNLVRKFRYALFKEV